MLESLNNLVRQPRIGRLQRAPGVRKVLTQRYPSRVYYTVDEVAVEIYDHHHPASRTQRERSDA
jgi:hypothetical protein